MAKRQQRRQKHIPQRTCIVCREVRSKRDLTRLVRTPEGVQVDLEGKQAGRGAYLCDKPACWREAAQGQVLERALKTKLADEERAMIAAHVAQH